MPTVCLLWFMNQAVKNERLAVRQKLMDLYTERAEYFLIEAQDLHVCSLFIEPVVSQAEKAPDLNNPHHLFALFAAEPMARYRGMLIYDSAGRLLYPVQSVFLPAVSEVEIEAARLEQAADSPNAFAVYRQIAEETNDSSVRRRMQLSMSRCLEKLDRRAEAIELAAALAWPDRLEEADQEQIAVTMHARAWLAYLYQQAGDRDRLFACLQRSLDPLSLPMAPAPAVIWHLQRSIDTARRVGLADRLHREIERSQHCITACENALCAAELYPTAPDESRWPDKTIIRLRPDGNLYGIRFQAADQTLLALAPADVLLNLLLGAVEDLQDDMVTVQVRDNFGQVIAGQKGEEEDAFLTFRPGQHYADFQVAVFFRDGVFEKAAGQQTMVYLWTGALGIGLVLLTGLAAIRTVSRQARRNRLKNDFIATVTHELKTPLSSTRLLVETLLENGCIDERQTREYLKLIARENLRLSRLIDNFLTFSRMERNKQSFTFDSTDPAEIARTAADAVLTKFNHPGRRLTLEIADPLPKVRADRDAMATVLVNLLDNAWKYSGDKKQIELRVFTEENRVCFAVRDNGIGLNRRQTKKIFDRFYQVDRSLARKAEGTGLGLSIVKFIVEAHRGRIRVESKAGAGSTFTVSLPQESGRD